jgi:hypothetical protein
VHDGGRAAFMKVLKWLEMQPTYQKSQGRDHYAMGIPWDRTRRPFEEINLFGPETPTRFSLDKPFPLEYYMQGIHDIVIP